MKTKYGAWHVVHVEEDGDEWAAQLLHPGCPFSFESEGPLVTYRCGPAWEVENVGFDTIFPDGIPEETSWWKVRTWSEVRPGLPTDRSGFSWVDTGVEVERLR